MMPPRRELLTIPVADRLWTFGYDWLLTGKQQSLTAQAEAEAANTGADVVVYRRDTPDQQYGLGYLEPTDRANGMAAAAAFAAYLAARKTTSGLGLFPLPAGHWWLIEVNEASIDPESDSVYPDLAGALPALAERLGARYWENLYLPEALIDEARLRLAEPAEAPPSPIDSILTRGKTDRSSPPDQAPLDGILANRTAEHYSRRKIRSVDVREVLKQPAIRAAAGLAVAIPAALFIAVPLYRSWTTQPPKPVQAVLSSVMPELPPPNTPPPSARAELPAAWFEGCYAGMAQIADRKPLGWSLGELICSGNQATGALHRTPTGTFQELEESLPPGTVTFPSAASYNSAIVTISRPVPPGVRNEQLGVAEELRRALTAAGWQIGERITVEPFQKPQRPPRDLATWQQAKLTIATQISPPHWAALLSPFPGLQLTELRIDDAVLDQDLSKAQWTITGTIYAE